MSEEAKITWKDQETQELFEDSGISKFADFLEIEKMGEKFEIKSMREHKDKNTGQVNRSMTRIEAEGRLFFLKQASSKAFSNIINEFDAIEILPDFGLIPSEIAAFSLDKAGKKGFILLKELKGCFSIKDIIQGQASKDAIEDFISRKEVILERVAEKMRQVHKKGYAYPDWFAKHLYIKQASDDIALIDLERFRPLGKCPWYFGFPITSLFVKNKFWRKLRISLKSEMLPDDLLKRILHE